MNVQHYIAAQTLESAESLIHDVIRMPDDKKLWRPLDSGRNVHAQLLECASINTVTTHALRDQAPPIFDSSLDAAYLTENPTVDQTIHLVKTTAKLLAAQIEAFPDNKLDQIIDLPWGEKKPFLWLLSLGQWNMTYHLGQINYIQTLYGDR